MRGDHALYLRRMSGAPAPARPGPSRRPWPARPRRHRRRSGSCRARAAARASRRDAPDPTRDGCCDSAAVAPAARAAASRRGVSTARRRKGPAGELPRGLLAIRLPSSASREKRSPRQWPRSRDVHALDAPGVRAGTPPRRWRGAGPSRRKAAAAAPLARRQPRVPARRQPEQVRDGHIGTHAPLARGDVTPAPSNAILCCVEGVRLWWNPGGSPGSLGRAAVVGASRFPIYGATPPRSSIARPSTGKRLLQERKPRRWPREPPPPLPRSRAPVPSGSRRGL